MKKYLSLTLIPLILLLTSCGENEEIKQQQIEKKIKDEIETTLNTNDKAFCFYLGSIEFPYTRKTLTFPANKKTDVWVNNELNRRLELFSRLGLLESSKNKTNKSISYKLAQLNADTDFKDGSFCFGKVTLENLVVDNIKSKKLNINSSVDYTINNIPAWVNNEDFINYFYSQQLDKKDKDENKYLTFSSSYPPLVDQKFPTTLKSKIKLVKLNDGGLILDDKDSVWQSFYHDSDGYEWDKNHLTYAYYNASLGTHLAQKVSRNNQLISIWGAEPDPVLLAKVKTSANLARSNNQVVMQLYFDHAITKNRIKSATNKEENVSAFRLDKKIKISFDEEGLVSSFTDSYKKLDFIVEHAIFRDIDLKAESTTWKYHEYYYAKEQAYLFQEIDSRNRSLYNLPKAIESYQTDYTHKIVKRDILETEFIPVSVKYDSEDRILSFGKNMTFKYDDKNQLILRTINNNRYVMRYDKQGRLIKMSIYSDSNTDPSSECWYSKYNEKGDWTRKSCDGLVSMTRTIEYYD
ncbi:hypothetical protein RCS94_10815 [Orbaceae bacterium ac157xtp]